MPGEGAVFISVADRDKAAAVEVARDLQRAGLRLVATQGTRRYLQENGVESDEILKVHEGRPHVEDAIRSNAFSLVINSPQDDSSLRDGYVVRRAAVTHNVPYTTTMAAARAAAAGILAQSQQSIAVRALQDYHGL